jgi:hypothetical protein
MNPAADGPFSPARWAVVCRWIGDVIAVTVVFFLFSCSPTPDVNEAHYWAKARHFWDPSFCPTDAFLNSADAHWSFYLTLGQLTRWLPLDAAAGVGRWGVWAAMAVGWCALARCFDLTSFRAWLGAALLVVTTRWCHLSGEWVVGGAEAKGLAFGAIFLAVAAACRGRWGTAFLGAGIGAGFHVLAGGWTVVCLMLAGATRWWRFNSLSRTTLQEVRHVGTGLLLGGLFSLPGLIPALTLSAASSPDSQLAANSIYVLQRLPHHLVFWSFQPIQLVMFCGLVGLWLLVQTQAATAATTTGSNPTPSPLNALVLAALGLAAIGLALSLAVLFLGSWGESAVGLLRYYWFRTADVFLPLGVVLLGCQWLFLRPRGVCGPIENVASAANSDTAIVPRWARWAEPRTWVLCLSLACIAWEGHHVYRQVVTDPRPNADKASLPSDPDPQRTQAIFEHWRNVCLWIQQNTAEEALFLTPRSQQTFKWYAQRSEVVNWKDVPQDNHGLLEWQQRVQDCAPIWSSDFGIAVQDPIAIHQLATKYDVDYLVMTQYAYELQQRFGRHLPYRRVYPASHEQRTYYVVLAIDQWQAHPETQP